MGEFRQGSCSMIPQARGDAKTWYRDRNTDFGTLKNIASGAYANEHAFQADRMSTPVMFSPRSMESFWDNYKADQH